MGTVINEIRRRISNSSACWVAFLLEASGTVHRGLNRVLRRSQNIQRCRGVPSTLFAVAHLEGF